MEVRRPATAIDLSLVLSLYEEFAKDLRRVRESEAALYRAYVETRRSLEPGAFGAPSRLIPPRVRRWAMDHLPYPLLLRSRQIVKAVIPGHDLDPQSDDVENEITYLLIRRFQPQVVVEIAPCGGWSTTWILSALRDAGEGKLASFDVIDDSRRTVPRELGDGRWTFVHGDVRQLAREIPSKIDFLCLDAEHSEPFARWYIDHLFPHLSEGAVVSVDDVFHPALGRSIGAGEARTVLDWLARKEIRYFTAAPSEAPSSYEQIRSLKATLGMAAPIHTATANPAIYFSVQSMGPKDSSILVP
jgi:predicted O-methyltransferase YrrM